MKKNTVTYLLILSVSTLLLLWLLPAITQKIADAPYQYPFVHYSPVLKKLCLVDFDNETAPLRDIDGKVYESCQFDSLMPLLNYKQLVMDGKLPDSISGHRITLEEIQEKKILFRYFPSEKQTPDMGLCFMYESAGNNINLEIPKDVFRIKNSIEFIDFQSNKVDMVKSKLFNDSLLSRGYQYPTKWITGNLSPRKPYDEGYLLLDANENLFHLKMVSGKPYARNTQISRKVKVAHFSMLEVADKRFLGFLFDTKGLLYILKKKEQHYELQKLDIPPIDILKDNLLIMGDMLYWSVTVSNSLGEHYYALDTQNLTRVDEYREVKKENKWDYVSKYLFPYYIYWDANTEYVVPKVHFTGEMAFFTHIVWGLFAVYSGRKRKYSTIHLLWNILFVGITGIAGLIALFTTPSASNKIRCIKK